MISSAKKDFMAGADLRMLQKTTDSGLSAEEIFNNVKNLNLVLRRLEPSDADRKGMLKGKAFAKPIVAAVPGMALGGGFEIALAAHFRVCAPAAQFGLPEVLVGLLPGGGGAQRLTPPRRSSRPTRRSLSLGTPRVSRCRAAQAVCIRARCRP